MTDILSVPHPTKEKGQRSLSAEDAYFTRFIPSWTFPSGLSPAQWRSFVMMQPVAVNFRDTLIMNVQSLDWKVTPRDSELRDELKNSIRYHTELFERGGRWLDIDWTAMVEWVLTDLLDLPFGTAVEVGRTNDSPGGRVAWFKPLDGGTLYPTLNKNFPVMQYYASAVNVINFPAHAINRMYLSPRSEIEREGWGMAPPEKIFMAMQMLARGDQYYANLLLDVPPAGILDLGDMAKDDALDWIKSFRTFVANGGVDGFKIPVLYEHTTKPEFIEFGKVPNDIMFDRITLKYAALVGAAYGMSLNDIGLQGTSSSGETLAGSIRQERRTRKTGLSRIKKKLKMFFECMLPPTLQFDWIDLDDELATAKGRARLATATALNQLITTGIIDRKEGRGQLVADGLMTISMPEDPPSKPDPAFSVGKPPERPGSVGSPQAPSQGGDGEVKKSVVEFKTQISALDRAVESIVNIFSPNLQEILNVGEDEYDVNKSMILESVFTEQDSIGEALKVLMSQARFGEFKFDGLEREIYSVLDSEGIYSANVEDHVEELKSRIRDGFSDFVGKAIVYKMIEAEFPDIPEMQEYARKSLEECAYTYVSLEFQKTLDDIRNGSLEIPEILRVRSIVRNLPLPPNITVESPNISLPQISVSVPERAVEAPVVNVQPEINVHVPRQEPPDVNVYPAEVNVSIPEREVTVNVPEYPAPVVNLSVPEQSAPIVNVQSPEVNVSIQPTPVEVTNPVTVNVPRVKKEQQTVHRDVNMNIDTTETNIIYEDDK